MSGSRRPGLPGAGPAEITLRSSEFRRGREDSWRQLAELVERMERRGVGALSVDELTQLPLLYRTALSSLSVARSIVLDRNLLRYLDNLALRGFLCVYGPRIGFWRGAGDFIRRGFPAAVGVAGRHVLLALLALAAGGIVGFALTVGHESWFSALVPTSLAGGRGPASSRAELHDRELFAAWPGPLFAIAVVANFLFTHNTMVGILSFGLGFAAGVPTLLLLAYQGVVLGAFLALHYDRGLAVEFLGWVSIHGVTELTAIALCGGAGLLIADKLLFPGRYSRVDSLAMHGRAAGQIAVGAVGLFFIAAILEGVFRQLVQSTTLRFAVGAATALLWTLYLARRPSGDAR